MIAREARVVAALARRALSLQFRKAQFLVPTFVLPLLLLAVIASGTSVAQTLPGFPSVGSYLGFVTAGTLVQGTLLAGLTAGTSMAGDIEGGFFDRLLTSPVKRTSLVLGRLCGSIGLVIVQATFFLLVALLFGATFAGGVPGALGAIGIAAVTAIGTSGVAAAIALRTGSLSLLQNLFPFMFVLLFTAPTFFPRDLVDERLQAIADVNPLTYIVEGMRAMLAGDASLGSPWAALASAAGLAVVMTFLATLALRSRLKRL